MRVCLIICALLSCLSECVPLSARSVDFAWGKTKVKGVNIGGWLVLEPWITPSIFEKYNDGTIDEWTLCEKHASDAPGILETHWSTWVKKSDLQTIFDAGFNMIRIPIGYWAFAKFNDPYIKSSQLKYLNQAITWAEDIGLKVIIDLHGAPLSQNGYDNSGHKGSALWTTQDSIQHTRQVLQQIAGTYAKGQYQKTVVGIQLLNEPNPDLLPKGSLDKTVQYYKDGFGDVRTVSDTPVILHDAFKAGSFWNNVLPQESANNVIIDHHDYQMFDEKIIAQDIDQHLKQVCTNANSFAKDAGHWTVVGEWSAALTDCATGLNGWDKKDSTRWEGTYITSKKATGKSCQKVYGSPINDDSSWQTNQELRTKTQKFIKQQLDTFLQRTQGFFFWNFKTEKSPEWDLLRLLQWGIFPKMQNYQPSSVCS